MRRFAFRSVILVAAASAVACWVLCATPWKLVLKSGKTVECDGAPIAINGVYLFRDSDGKDGSVATDQVDQEKTDRANHVAPPPGAVAPDRRNGERVAFGGGRPDFERCGILTLRSCTPKRRS